MQTPAAAGQNKGEKKMTLARRGGIAQFAVFGALTAFALAFAAPASAQEVTVLCNFEVDWCEALKAAYEKTTGQKAVFIRRTDGESLAQIRAEKSNPRADIYHAAESASAKQLAAEGLLEAYKSPRVAELHDWAQRIAEENQYFQTPIYTGVLGFGYNTELLAKKKLPEPKCWKDLANPAYKDEIQMANPGSSGTAFNMVSTILQMMGEDEGFRFLAAMNKNVNQYTRSGSAGIRAAGKGETSVVFQAPTLAPRMSAAANVALPLELAGTSRTDARVQAVDALAKVGLAGAENARPAQLSGGMAMRASLARALVTRPRLLLLDEPFAALDEITRRALADDVLVLAAELAPAVVFVTHNVEEAVYMARRVVVMSAGPGRIVGEVAVEGPVARPPGFRATAAFRETAEQVSRLLAGRVAA